MDDVLGRQLVERLQMVQHGLLDDVAAGHAGLADILVHEFQRELRNVHGNLWFLTHAAILSARVAAVKGCPGRQCPANTSRASLSPLASCAAAVPRDDRRMSASANPSTARSAVRVTRMVAAAGESKRTEPKRPRRHPTNPKIQPCASARPTPEVAMSEATAGMTSSPNTSRTPAICTAEVTTRP